MKFPHHSSQITYTFRPDGDEATQKRISEAAETAIGWWNELTGDEGLPSQHRLVDGVPTADCSYGGWIRVGPTPATSCGTIMHELYGLRVFPGPTPSGAATTPRES